MEWIEGSFKWLMNQAFSQYNFIWASKTAKQKQSLWQLLRNYCHWYNKTYGNYTEAIYHIYMDSLKSFTGPPIRRILRRKKWEH